MNPTAEISYRDFQNPAVEWRGKPFWAWNGLLESGELRRQIDAFGRMGMGGFFMHSRVGLRTPYLSDEWFALINECADYAQQQGLQGWLYDEDRWPSGLAGGLASKEPQYQMQHLRLRVVEAGESVDWPKHSLLGAFLATLDGVTLANYEEVTSGSIEQVPEGQKLLIFTQETAGARAFYNGVPYLDTMRRDATANFLHITHDSYAEHCGTRFGESIAGIFTDEPHRGMLMCAGVDGVADSEYTAPYTEALFAEFGNRFAGDLRSRLPELFYVAEGEEFSRLKWEYVELLQQLFLENWAEPMQAWTRTHGLVLTGHVLHEDSLAAQVIPCGSLMRYYAYLDQPGIDILGSRNKVFWAAKQVVSVARQQGKKRVLSEMYGGSGWDFDFSRHKEIGDWQAVLGVNERCHHLSWYTMEGEAKRDYPGSISFQCAWSDEYRLVETYYARLHWILAQGRPSCEVLVISPIESLWGKYHVGWATWLRATEQSARMVEERYIELFRWLSESPLDFDYGDEDHLCRMGDIEEDQSGPLLCLGAMRYRVVVVGGLTTMRASTAALLEEFVTKGGCVVFAGEAPAFVDARPSGRGATLAARATKVTWDRQPVTEAVRAGCRSALEILSTGQSLDGILTHVRETNEGWVVVVLNTSRDRDLGRLRISFPADCLVEEWCCRSGVRAPVESGKIGGNVTWGSDFPALQERAFVLSPVPREAEPFRDPAPIFLKTRLVSELDGISFSEPNICVLDRARFQIDGEPWRSEKEILQIDDEVRRELGLGSRGTEMLQPWIREPASPLARLRLRYEFTVTSALAALDLVLERPDVKRISVDGRPLHRPDKPSWFIDPAFHRIPLPPGVRAPGLHAIEVETDFSADTDLEALYLVGDFVVFLEGSRPVLANDRPAAVIGDLCTQGYPFYSGVMSYVFAMPSLPEIPQTVQVRFGLFGAACIRVRQGEVDSGSLVAFPPYVASLDPALLTEPLFVDVYLTRRNTFGPLHLVPQDQPMFHPLSFRSRGDEFTKDYQLIPSGLLELPVVEWSSFT